MKKINYLTVLIILLSIINNGCKSSESKPMVNQQAYDEIVEINRQSVDTRKLMKDWGSLNMNIDNINNPERLKARQSEADQIINDFTTWKKTLGLIQSKLLQAINGGSETDSSLHCQYFNEHEESKIQLKQVESMLELANLYKTFFASFATAPKKEEFLSKAEEFKIKQEAQRFREINKSLGEEANKLADKAKQCTQNNKN